MTQDNHGAGSKRLWVVSQFYAEETGTGYSMTRIAEGLAEYFSVAVLCGQPHYVSRDRHAPSREERNGVLIQRVMATPFNNDSLLLKLINMVTISFSMFIQVVRRIESNDLVFFTNLPPTLPFAIAAACNLRGARCVLRIDDVYPDGIVVAGMIHPDGVLRRILEWLYKRLYQSVDYITVLGRDTQRLIVQKLGNQSNRVVIMPNAVNLKEVYPMPRSRNVLLSDLGLSDKFVVKYAGHMGRTHGLEYLLEAIEKLREIPDIHFLFIGSGPQKGWLEEMVAEKNLRNVTIIPYRPRSELCDAINACDVAIVSLAPGMCGVSVPGRIYDLLAAGKPIIVIAERDSEPALIVREEGVGWVTPPGKPDEVVKAILDARSQSEDFFEMRRRARLAAEKKYSLRQETEAYRSLLWDLADAEL